MSTVNLAMAVVLACLYSVGFYLLMQRSLMHILLGIVIIGHGANLLLQLAGGPPGVPPILGDNHRPEEMTDPLPQAMALTAIVITFALTTFLLALSYRAWTLLGRDEVRDDVEDKRIRRLETGPESRGDTADRGGPDRGGQGTR